MNKLPFFVFNVLTRNFRLLLRHNIERMDLNQDWSEFTEYVNAQAGVKGTAFLEANAHAGSQAKERNANWRPSIFVYKMHYH